MDTNQKSNDQPQKEQKDPAILAKIRDLLAKRGAPISTDVNSMAKADSVPEENYAKGGSVMAPKDVIGLPGVPDPSAKPMDPRIAAGLPGVPALPGMPSQEEKMAAIKKAMEAGKLKMADGGDVDPSELPMSADAPQENKLQAILKAIGMAGSNAVSSILPGTQTLADKIAPPAASAASLPGVAPAINSALGTSLQEPPAQSGAPLPPAPPLPSAPSLMPSPSAPTAPKAAPSAPAPDPLAGLGKADTSVPGLEPQDRQALSTSLNQNQHTFGNYLAEAIAGLGDAVAAKGGVQQNALGNIFALQTQQRQEALDSFDKARQAAVEHFNMKNQADQALINNLKARGELIVSPQIAKALGHPELANRPTNQADLVLKTDAMRYDFANKMQERKQSALKGAAEDIDKAEAHGGLLGTQKWTTPQARLQAIHAQAIKNDPEAFGYTVSGGK